jgi:hypothetical protein
MKVKTYGNAVVPVAFNGSFLDCLTFLNGDDIFDSMSVTVYHSALRAKISCTKPRMPEITQIYSVSDSLFVSNLF